MTADDIIAANPAWQFRYAKIGAMDGLKGVDPSNGVEVWVLLRGDKHVVAEGPWSDAQIFFAQEQLLAATGQLQHAGNAMN